MKNMKIDDIISQAKKMKSYLLTLTIRDKDKNEDNLKHYLIQEDFPIDDIVPSIDSCLESMNVKSEKSVPVVKPEKPLREKKKPLKIAILTHFNRCPDSYSPCGQVKNQIRMLRHFGHEVVFFTQEGSKLDIGCEMRPVVPKFKREKNVVNEDAKQKFINVLREQLTDDFDLAITHDFYIDDCITYREAIKECGVPIKWIHWARSGVGKPINFKMENARYVYMNYSDVGRFAKMIGINPEEVRVVFNEKDPSLLFKWHLVTEAINEKMRLWDKDIIQTYPMCTTRMDAKGINSVIKIFGLLKSLGNNVALIICNSNGRKRVNEIEKKIEYAKSQGLTEDDILFTSTFSLDKFDISREVPHDAVTQLFRISNLFIFPTIAEVCSNVLLEASMTKNLIVVNKDLKSLFDFVDKESVLSHPFTSSQNIHYEGRDEDSMLHLAKQINGQIKADRADKQFRHVWRKHSFDNVYYEQLEPILYEDEK